ncbi:Hypothetical protein CpOVI2C_02000 [Corynebacterium pseudotuberculosis]|nr:Hypothetical protein CpPAT10_0634a [Corynebacterium pseudotuberculosis PAT10]AFF21789.1 Hypothetical protein CpP54B96_0645 [Corynebacterium pseudotuberculosis P54B96]AFH51566.1 Hypothetical protein Cp267_0663 [Corynebacterium pseudotuberculosis 267]AIG07014.1 hypothetical protein CPTA_01185 [Corynebacterium pseudotuberculosis]AIG08403.1 hypothetical protein CPTB_00347 [Corynebacterium pseudotuberculosis]
MVARGVHPTTCPLFNTAWEKYDGIMVWWFDVVVSQWIFLSL